MYIVLVRMSASYQNLFRPEGTMIFFSIRAIFLGLPVEFLCMSMSNDLSTHSVSLKYFKVYMISFLECDR